jgi:hypothetical protein
MISDFLSKNIHSRVDINHQEQKMIEKVEVEIKSTVKPVVQAQNHKKEREVIDGQNIMSRISKNNLLKVETDSIKHLQ